MLFAALPPAPPPAVIYYQQPRTLPPLSFLGLRAGVPLQEVRAFLEANKSRLDCKASSDPRMKECTGTVPYPGVPRGLALLVSSINDSAAVLVFTARGNQTLGQEWERALTEDFGQPNHEARSGAETRQWIRKGQMMRLVQRKTRTSLECSVTLTDGPLLDGLGPPKLKRPD